MTKEEAKEKALALISNAEGHYEWGGSEDENGTLHPGSIDWEELRTGIAKVIDSVS